MLKYNLKIALRSLLKSKTYSIINIFGLSVGLITVLLITLWVKDELSFDKFHKNQNEIYRIIGGDQSTSGIFTPKPLASLLKKDIPEIVNATRLMQFTGIKFEYNKSLYQEVPTLVEESFFEMFSFPFIEGGAESLQKPASIVITQSLAQRMFGNKPAVGQNIMMHITGGVKKELTITGIIKDLPSNSHLESDCFISVLDFWKSLINDNFQQWEDWGTSTYVQTLKNANTKEIKDKIDHCIIQNSNNTCEFRVSQLQSLKDIHLFSSFDNDYAKCGNIKYVYIFSFMVFLIALIVLINYVNLTNSLAINRIKEIGIKKSFGVKRFSLIKQFLSESLIVMLIASIFVIALIRVVGVSFNQLTNKSIEFNLSNSSLLILLAGSIFIIGIISGLFPAFYLSSFKTVAIMQSKSGTTGNTPMFRNTLLVIQLCITIAAISGALIVRKQIQYVQNMNLGFDKEQLVYFNIMKGSAENIDLIKEELLKYPKILGVTSGHLLTSMNYQSTSSFNWPDKEQNEQYYAYIHRVDYDFQNTYKTEIKQGRFFSKEYPSDKTSAYVLNESAIKKFHIKNPVGKSFSLWGNNGKIIGVIKDYHFESARKEVSPTVLWMNTEKNYGGYESLTIRMQSDALEQTLDFVQALIQKNNNGFKPDYQFIDSAFGKLYISEKQFSSIFNISSILAILLSCLGLLGFIIHSSKLRIKEIGIRKVNGAKVGEIFSLLNKDIIKWIFIALIIACPLTWYVMDKWLQNFAYRININGWIFILAGLLISAISFLTVSLQNWKAANSDPVKSLKYE